MIAEIARTNPVGTRLDAYRDGGATTNTARRADGAERRMCTVPIFRNTGSPNVEKKVVAMCSIREIGSHLPACPGAQAVVCGQQRLVGPFVRRGSPIKAIRAEVLPQIGNQ